MKKQDKIIQIILGDYNTLLGLSESGQLYWFDESDLGYKDGRWIKVKKYDDIETNENE